MRDEQPQESRYAPYLVGFRANGSTQWAPLLRYAELPPKKYLLQEAHAQLARLPGADGVIEVWQTGAATPLLTVPAHNAAEPAPPSPGKAAPG
jgi:hypothetical protein